MFVLEDEPVDIWSRHQPCLTPLILGQSRDFSWKFRVGWGMRQLVSINFSAAMGWMALTSLLIPSVVHFLCLSSLSIICMYTTSKVYKRSARIKTNKNQKRILLLLSQMYCSCSRGTSEEKKMIHDRCWSHHCLITESCFDFSQWKSREEPEQSKYWILFN